MLFERIVGRGGVLLKSIDLKNVFFKSIDLKEYFFENRKL